MTIESPRMTPQNHLLDAFPADVRARLGQRMERVPLTLGQVLHRPNQQIRDVYFPLDCLISVTVTMLEARTAEARIVGNREMVGLNAFMGGRTTNQTEYICQSPGFALKIPAEPFLAEFDRVKEVRDLLLRFTQAYIAQLSQNVACNRLHTLQQRLARWLLECRDRRQSDEMGVSHHFLCQMLGSRRAGVTEAIGKLQALGLIEGNRNKRRILDFSRLGEASCECFDVLRVEYARLLEPRISPARGDGGVPPSSRS